jgi:hypothetical protein
MRAAQATDRLSKLRRQQAQPLPRDERLLRDIGAPFEGDGLRADPRDFDALAARGPGADQVLSRLKRERDFD